MATKDLNYEKTDAQMSCIRKYYKKLDDITQFYIETTGELNTKLQFIFNEFDELDVTKTELLEFAIKMGINKCCFYTDNHLDFSAFLHHEILKDYEDNKDQLIIFDEQER